MQKLVMNKNRGWRGLAEARILDDDNNTVQSMIFSFSQEVWYDMILDGLLVMKNAHDYIVIRFDRKDKLPKQTQQRSVLIKDVVLPIINITKYAKDTWSIDAHGEDYRAIRHFKQNRNNHTTSVKGRKICQTMYEM